jgi:integrase
MNDEIAAINARLKQARIPVAVRLNGNYLVLRANLPKKPGDGDGKKRYDISLKIPGNKDGLRRIEAEAQKLGSLITLNRFSWDAYLKPQDEPQEKITAELVSEFKSDYSRSHRVKESTWAETWQRTFDRLPQNEALTGESILAVVLTTEPHTRNRELTCQRLQKLADYADIPIDLKPYQGEYNERETKPRKIPADELIVQWRDRIPSERGWQWVYGLIATFGIRPHEAFFCEFVDSMTLKVIEGKTGARITRAIHPEWAEQWQLIDIQRPNITGRSHRDYGQRTSRQFARYEVPFVPYDLRHAFAIRGSIVKHLPVSTMASMMGHSVNVHTRIYHRWLSDATNEEVYRKIILGLDN